jgi:uncharacterized membrane protein YeaQ/YmgE (transglycosylase-associated protein family)
MNTVIWLIAGGVVAAAAFSALNLNVARGLAVAMVIGIFAAYFGGSILSPLLGGGTAVTGEFNPLALLVASCTALGALYLSDTIYERFGA